MAEMPRDLWTARAQRLLEDGDPDIESVIYGDKQEQALGPIGGSPRRGVAPPVIEEPNVDLAPALRETDPGWWRNMVQGLIEKSGARGKPAERLIEDVLGSPVRGKNDDMSLIDLTNIPGLIKQRSEYEVSPKGGWDKAALAAAAVPFALPVVKGAVKVVKEAAPVVKEAAEGAGSTIKKAIGSARKLDDLPEVSVTSVRRVEPTADELAGALRGERNLPPKGERAAADEPIPGDPRDYSEMAVRRRGRGGERPPPSDEPPPPPGGNEPPGGPPPDVPLEWYPPRVSPVRFPRQGAFRDMTQVPDIRRMEKEEAIARALENPHLIERPREAPAVPAAPVEEGAAPVVREGLYVGGPRDIQTPRNLTTQRQRFDRYVGRDPRGGDWYDRYRPGMQEATGGRPEVNDMQAALHGQLSAGVDPGTETAMAIRMNNQAIASGGVVPQGKGAAYGRPENRAALQRAIDRNDPAQLGRGPKTSEYTFRINPNNADLVRGATGVNDFRYMRAWGYTNPDNTLPQAGKHPRGSAIQKFMDYETAQAVARANRQRLGGRDTWTGEQLQAAPWVRQKALDIQERAGKHLEGDLKGEFKKSYEEAFQEANKTFTDYLNKHTLNATYEQLPGSVSRHLTGLQASGPDVKKAFFNDPRSRETVPGGNYDAYYGSLFLPHAPGIAVNVRPTLNMQGVYTNKQGGLEFNPGEVARPLLGFVNTPEGKKIAPEDKKMATLVEALRAYINANELGVGHMIFENPRTKDINAFTVPFPTGATETQARAVQALSAPHKMPDVADTGRGLTVANFESSPTGKEIAAALRGSTSRAAPRPPLTAQIEAATGSRPRAVGMDSIYHSWGDEMKLPEGSGEMTRRLLGMMQDDPHVAGMLERSPNISQIARNKMERDADFAERGVQGLQVPGVAAMGHNNPPPGPLSGMSQAQFDQVREDFQNARRIIAENPGSWQTKLRQALDEGKIKLPAIVLPMLGLPPLLDMAAPDRGEDRDKS